MKPNKKDAQGFSKNGFTANQTWKRNTCHTNKKYFWEREIPKRLRETMNKDDTHETINGRLRKHSIRKIKPLKRDI